MRLLAVLAVAVVINPSQSQFLAKKKTNNKKRHKNTQKRDKQRYNGENSFKFPELEIDRFFNQEKVNYTSSNLELGPKSPLAVDVIGWIRQVESQFDKKPDSFRQNDKIEDFDVDMSWGRSFGGPSLVGCDDPRYDSDDEFIVNDEVTMVGDNGGNCEFLEPGHKCDFVCKPNTKKSQRFGGIEVPANGVTSFVCLCMGPYCGFGISNYDERDFWERDADQRVIGCGGFSEVTDEASFTLLTTTKSETTVETAVLAQMTTTDMTTTDMTTVDLTTAFISTMQPTTVTTTPATTTAQTTTEETTTTLQTTTTAQTTTPATTTSSTTTNAQIFDKMMQNLNITQSLRGLGFQHPFYDGSADHFETIPSSNEYQILSKSDTIIQTLVSNIEKIENTITQNSPISHLKHYMRYNHLIHLFKVIDFLSFKIVSTEETMPTRFLKYGCWCFFHYEPEFEKYKFMEPHRGMGNARDNLDSACRRYENCVQCAKLEFGDSCHADRAYSFETLEEFGENVFTCTDSLDGGSDDEGCRRKLCDCDKKLAEDLSVEQENFEIQHSTQFGGDFNKYTCYLSTRTKLEPADSCCGDGASRTPFNSGRAECCDGGFVKGLGFGGC